MMYAADKGHLLFLDIWKIQTFMKFNIKSYQVFCMHVLQYYPINDQWTPHIENSQPNCSAIRMTGFYRRETLDNNVLNETLKLLVRIWSLTDLLYINLILNINLVDDNKDTKTMRQICSVANTL